MTHPLILAYSETYEKDFPIILVVGREPNNETVSDYTIGHYDFIQYPRCSFWNMAFKLFGATNSNSIKEIKHLFLQKNSSPIVFTDASTQGIVNKIVDKNCIRNSIQNSCFTNVESIFSNEKLMKRVKLILLSGLSNNVYSDFKNALIEKATKIEIPLKEISFLYGTNYPKILKEITDVENSIMKDVYIKFEAKNSI